MSKSKTQEREPANLIFELPADKTAREIRDLWIDEQLKRKGIVLPPGDPRFKLYAQQILAATRGIALEASVENVALGQVLGLIANDRLMRASEHANAWFKSEQRRERLERPVRSGNANRLQANMKRREKADRDALAAVDAWCNDQLFPGRKKLAQLPRSERIQTYLKQARPSRREGDRLKRLLREGLPLES